MEPNNAPQETTPDQPFRHPIKIPTLNHKGVITPILIAIVTFLVITTGGYFLYQKQASKTTSPQQISQPTPSPISDDTANWKTYTNNEYNFSFNYPQNRLVRERIYPDTQGSYKFMVLLLSQQMTDEQFEGSLTHEWGDFYIGIDSKLHTEKDLEKEEIVEGRTTENGTSLNKLKYEQITMNGLKANKVTRLSRTEMDEDKRTWIKFNQGGYGWTIHFPNIDFEGNHNPVYDQILSTFKFTDQNVTLDTSNWKTVTFTLEDFSFQYPADKLFPDLPFECFTKTTNPIVFDAEFHLKKPSSNHELSQDYRNCTYPGEDGTEFSVIISTNQTPYKINSPERSKPFKIAGHDATLIYNRGTLGGTNQRLIYFDYNDYRYLIYIPTGLESGSGDTISSLFTQILSTFKFQ